MGIYFSYFMTYWSWLINILSLTLTILASWKPDYWNVTAFAWLEMSHGLNIFETVLFWIFLAPGFYGPIEWSRMSDFNQYEWFMIFHMLILHVTPLATSSLNIYLSDIRIQKNDWHLILFLNIV